MGGEKLIDTIATSWSNFGMKHFFLILGLFVCVPLMGADKPSIDQKLIALEGQLRALGFSEKEIKEAVEKARKKNAPKNPDLNEKLADLEKQLRVLNFSNEEIEEALAEARQKHMGNKPRPLPKNLAELKARAEAGDATAQYSLGLRYYQGKGVKRDSVTAYAWWEIAASNGNKAAESDKRILDKALTIQQVKAAHKLAWELKKTLPMDFKYLKVLAENGNVDAQFELGMMYNEGKGVEQDFKEAVKWYQKAADQGDAGAQYALGHLYYNGMGVKEDRVTAYALCLIASANGNGLASVYWKPKLDKQMTSEQVAEAEALVKEMVKKNPKLLNK